MKSLSFKEKYAVLGKQESIYEGLFITAVKTTGIFCRPSCRARKPLAKNVEFFDDVGTALRNGYRPCKICKPMELEGKTPSYIQNLISRIEQQPYQKIKDQDLRKLKLEPNHIRRWFKIHHGMTFHAYQRMIRLNLGFQQIQQGEKVIKAAFESGFDSLSGFNEGYKKIFGEAPTKSKDASVIYIHRFGTKLGPMFICATEKGVCLLEFTERRGIEKEFLDLRKRTNSVIVPGRNHHIKQAQEEIGLYLDSRLKKFKVPLDLIGTDFQKSVWQLLLKIPYGETRSYSKQAKALKNPKAVRAVARANGMNKVALIVPCHRVIGADGNLTGYAGGLPRKEWLLKMEGAF